jgi:hypothetical protein
VSVEFHGLTDDEKNLIRVSKFYHSNESDIEKLVVKFVKNMNFDRGTVGDMFGISRQQVTGIVRRLGFTAEFNTPKPKEAATFDERLTEMAVRPGPLFDESELAGRISNELHEQFGSRFKQGDKFTSRKELMQAFEITSKTAGDVMANLVRADLIEFAEPGNFRKGYVVK